MLEICKNSSQLNYHYLSRVVVPATLHSISVNAHFTRFLQNLETVKKCAQNCFNYCKYQ